MKSCSRRSLFKLAGAGSLALILPATMRVNTAFAQEQLDPENAQAKALGYVHDTEQVDQGKYPTHETSQVCANCQLVQGNDGDWVGCALFPNKLVNANGWCSAWVAKQG